MNERIEQEAEAIAENCIGKKTRNHPANQLEKIIIRNACLEMAKWLLSHQWISVDEELPKEKFDDGYQFVFVRIQLNDDTFYFDTDYIRKGKCELHKNQKITHWMQIPTLKGGEE